MIVVTGLGAVTALGSNVASTWERLVRGDRGFREVSLFSAEGYRSRVVAEVSDVASRPEGTTLSDARGSGDYSDYSRTSELGLTAAREALASAGLVRDGHSNGKPWGGLRVGFVMGGSTAGMLETESLLAVLVSPEGTVDPAVRKEALRRMLSHPLSAPTDRLVRELGPFARVRTLSSACSSGANALLVAATWLELDLVDVVLTGAADALCRVTVSGFNALAALDPTGARPFDRRRKGLTLGEGAGFLVIEREASAAARSKRAICAFMGWAARSEAHHITNPEPSGDAPVRAMNAALARAGIGPSTIDYVNAHGTGTPLNDPMETRALGRVFGPDLQRVAVSSNKGQIGHTLAAAGAIEAVVTAVSIASGVVPPTGGLEEPDPDCALVHVPVAESRPIRAALSSSFGFGGMDTVLVFGQTSESPTPPVTTQRRRVVVTGVATLTPGHLLGGLDVADLPSLPQGGATVGADLTAGLHAERARRLDRSSRLATVAAERALRGASGPDIGVVLGSAFGAVDGSASFMRRLCEKGPRLVSPADFPTLVPSSPAGYVSIYLGLSGPAMVVADLGNSGEAAFTQGFELVAAGETPRILVSVVEERSTIVEQVLGILFGARAGGAEADADAGAVRREGAAAIALASVEAARSGDLPVLAEVDRIVAWTANDVAPLAGLPMPGEGRVVVVQAGSNTRVSEVLAASEWSRCERISCAEHAGTHEAVGGLAIAVASALVARGDVAAALCVGSARGSGYAVLLRRWAS